MSQGNVPYARGSRAWGECARSGKKMLLKNMVEDPLTHLLVDPAWAEPPLMRPAVDIIDGTALERPAPDLDAIEQGTTIFMGTIFDWATGEAMPLPWAYYSTSSPTITVT